MTAISLKHRFNSKFVRFMDEHNDILNQDFVSLAADPRSFSLDIHINKSENKAILIRLRAERLNIAAKSFEIKDRAPKPFKLKDLASRLLVNR